MALISSFKHLSSSPSAPAPGDGSGTAGTAASAALLAAQMAPLKQEARMLVNSDTVFFLDHPTVRDLGYRAVLQPHSPEQLAACEAADSTPLAQEISLTLQLVSDKINKLQTAAAPENMAALTSSLPDLTEMLGVTIEGNPVVFQTLKIFELNARLSHEARIKVSLYFLNCITALLELFPLIQELKDIRLDPKRIQAALYAASCDGLTPVQKERISTLALKLTAYDDICQHLEQVTTLGRALCTLNDTGAILGMALYGLDNTVQALVRLHQYYPDRSLDDLISDLVTALSNQTVAALLSYNDLITGTNGQTMLAANGIFPLSRKEAAAARPERTPGLFRRKAPDLILTSVSEAVDLPVSDALAAPASAYGSDSSSGTAGTDNTAVSSARTSTCSDPGSTETSGSASNTSALGADAAAPLNFQVNPFLNNTSNSFAPFPIPDTGVAPVLPAVTPNNTEAFNPFIQAPTVAPTELPHQTSRRRKKNKKATATSTTPTAAVAAQAATTADAVPAYAVATRSADTYASSDNSAAEAGDADSTDNYAAGVSSKAATTTDTEIPKQRVRPRVFRKAKVQDTTHSDSSLDSDKAAAEVYVYIAGADNQAEGSAAVDPETIKRKTSDLIREAVESIHVTSGKSYFRQDSDNPYEGRSDPSEDEISQSSQTENTKEQFEDNADLPAERTANDALASSETDTTYTANSDTTAELMSADKTADETREDDTAADHADDYYAAADENMVDYEDADLIPDVATPIILGASDKPEATAPSDNRNSPITPVSVSEIISNHALQAETVAQAAAENTAAAAQVITAPQLPETTVEVKTASVGELSVSTSSAPLFTDNPFKPLSDINSFSESLNLTPDSLDLPQFKPTVLRSTPDAVPAAPEKSSAPDQSETTASAASASRFNTAATAQNQADPTFPVDAAVTSSSQTAAAVMVPEQSLTTRKNNAAPKTMETAQALVPAASPAQASVLTCQSPQIPPAASQATGQLLQAAADTSARQSGASSVGGSSAVSTNRDSTVSGASTTDNAVANAEACSDNRDKEQTVRPAAATRAFRVAQNKKQPAVVAATLSKKGTALSEDNKEAPTLEGEALRKAAYTALFSKQPPAEPAEVAAYLQESRQAVVKVMRNKSKQAVAAVMDPVQPAEVAAQEFARMSPDERARLVREQRNRNARARLLVQQIIKTREQHKYLEFDNGSLPDMEVFSKLSVSEQEALITELQSNLEQMKALIKKDAEEDRLTGWKQIRFAYELDPDTTPASPYSHVPSAASNAETAAATGVTATADTAALAMTAASADADAATAAQESTAASSTKATPVAALEDTDAVATAEQNTAAGKFINSGSRQRSRSGYTTVRAAMAHNQIFGQGISSLPIEEQARFDLEQSLSQIKATKSPDDAPAAPAATAARTAAADSTVVTGGSANNTAAISAASSSQNTAPTPVQTSATATSPAAPAQTTATGSVPAADQAAAQASAHSRAAGITGDNARINLSIIAKATASDPKADAADRAAGNSVKPPRIPKTTDLAAVLEQQPQTLRLKYCMLMAQYFLPESRMLRNLARRTLKGTLTSKIADSTLMQCLRPDSELQEMQQIMLTVLNQSNGQHQRLILQRAKFNYYQRLLGRSFALNSNRNQIEGKQPVIVSFKDLESCQELYCLLAAILLSAGNLYFKAVSTPLTDACAALHRPSPIS